MRALRTIVTVGFSIVVFATVAAVLGLYLATTGRSLPLLKSVAGRVGQVVSGQRTESIDLQVRIRPDVGELTATARLAMRSDVASRRNLYFLLNDGLRVSGVWREQADGSREALPFYRLWLVTVVSLPEPLDSGATIRIGMAYEGQPSSGWSSMGSNPLTPEETILTAADFWYPSDLQGFFTADVEVTAPIDLQILHKGRPLPADRHGLTRRVRWATKRPVAGLALVAGHYEQHHLERVGGSYDLFLPRDFDVDPDRVLDSLARSDQALAGVYGPAGFGGVSAFVSRRLQRSFYDGSGLIGLDADSFRGGDYGLGVIAHEVAHGWWGGTVAAKWLEPGTGGQWIVEGFAELSSWLVTRQALDERSWLRRLSEKQYDPSRVGSLASLSVLDNALDPSAAQTIYHKGGYVAYMLRQLLGEKSFATSVRELLERFRHRQVTEAELQAVFAEVSGADLVEFFDKWVRSDATLDLSLDPQDGGAAVHNHGTAPPPQAPALWRFVPNEEPARQTIEIDAATPLGNTERLVLDPLAQDADMFRSNNVFPRRDNPRAVLGSARGEFAIVYGEPVPWAPASVTQVDATGKEQHTWTFDRGLRSGLQWSADGTRLLAVEKKADGGAGLVALNATDGSRDKIGDNTDATGMTDGVVFARGADLVRTAGGNETVLARHPGGQVKNPVASPDGTRIAYAVRTGGEMDLRIVSSDTGGERLLLTVYPSPIRWKWSPDGSRLFAVIAGDWDWQVWELPADGQSTPRALVREAAAVIDLAPAADGERVAVIAAAELSYGGERREVFIIDRKSGRAQNFNLGSKNGHSLAWLDADALLVVVSDPTFPVVPPYRELMRLSLADGALQSFP
jgi:aminopeptidase